MAYNVVSQAGLESVSNATVSDAPRGSSPQTRPTNAFQQLPMHTENTGDGSRMGPASLADDSSMARLGSMMRSTTDTSYDMLEEDDDFEAADHSTRSNSLRRAARLDASARSTKSASPDPPLRNPSTDHPVPLSHPTPGLQSLQGAYVGNVERLERSAECLSSSSADIGSEIRKMDQEQKRRSGSSSSSSIAAAKSELPPPEPAPLIDWMDTEPRYEIPDQSPFPPTLPHLQMSAYDQRGVNTRGQCDPTMNGIKIERPSTTASNDTYQQAKTLFSDFDGVHFVSSDNGQESFRNVSMTRPPLATGSESHKQPQTGENMVYYPAPVPMTLNLPPRLSRKPAAERQKRRTQHLASFPFENRKSAARLSGHDQGGKDRRRSKPAAGLPPQLRASVFFEPPAASMDIERDQAPVTATLESILDASARGPATAFTDHPFAGHIGSEVYGGASHKARSKGLADQRKKRRSRNTLVSNHHTFPAGPRGNSAALGESEVDVSGLNEATSLRNDTAGNEARSDGDSSSEDEDTDGSHSRDGQEREDGDEEPDYVGPPNTLLAELQMRKQELKQRRRIAANPVGLHSTLLELDTVAQKQSEHRRQKRITLAWESPDVKQPDDEDNEDVPLAVLFPDKANLPQGARPTGLIEKREMEEGEPLSRRRARLRGEPPVESPGPKTRASTMHFQHAAEPAEAGSENEGETLGERLKRLKAKNRHSSAAESDFTTEVLAGLSHLDDGGEGDKGQDAAQEDETLAQRRARLQEAAKSQSGIDPKPHNHRKSMAALSQVHRAPGSRQPSYGPVPHRNSRDPRLFKNRMPMQTFSQHGPVHPAGYPQCPDYATTKSYGYAPSHPNTFYSDAILGANHLAYAAPTSCPKVPKPATEPGQQEMIDRWRRSVK